MASIYDDLRDKIHLLLDEQHIAIIQELIPIIHTEEFPIDIKERPPLDELLDYFGKKNEATLKCIEEICARYSCNRLLVAARKIPHKYIRVLWKRLPLETTPNFDSVIFEYSTYATTNAILRYSPHDHSLLIDDDSLIYDSFRLQILCSMRVMLYWLCQGARAYEDNTKFDLSTKGQIVFPEESFRFTEMKVVVLLLLPLWSLPAKGHCEVNFVPNFAEADKYLEMHQWLCEYDFYSHFDISFNKFYDCFTLLNMFVTSRVIPFKLDQLPKIKTLPDEGKSRMLTHLTDDGLIYLKNGELEKHFSQFSIYYPDITLREFHIFIDHVTMNDEDAAKIEIDNIEKPFLFYRLDSDGLYWDLVQHVVLLRSIARKVMSGGDAGNIKGRGFENYIFSKLKENDDIFEGLQRNVIIYSDDRVKLMDIDIGFVYNDVLYLLELKAYSKKKGQLLGRFYKGNRFVKHLRKYDELLKLHQDKVFENWNQYKFTKAVYVLLTEEFEIPPPLEPDLWLEFRKVPRICTLHDFFPYVLTQ